MKLRHPVYENQTPVTGTRSASSKDGLLRLSFPKLHGLTHRTKPNRPPNRGGLPLTLSEAVLGWLPRPVAPHQRATGAGPKARPARLGVRGR